MDYGKNDSSEELRDIASRIVGETSSILRDIVDEEGLGDVIGYGVSGDTTRRVDKEVEDYIISRLRETRYKYRIVTEEKGVIDTDNEIEYIALIDPLDGSLNYVSKIPLAAVSLVFYENNEPYLLKPVAGAVSNIFLKEIYSFNKAHVYVNNTRIDNPIIRREGLISIYSDDPLFIKNVVNKVKTEINMSVKTRTLGSAALESIYASLGRIDLFIHNTGRLRNLDIAGGVAIAVRLGVDIIDLYGGGINYRVDRIEKIRSIGIGSYVKKIFTNPM